MYKFEESFGKFGGRYVPEALERVLIDLQNEFEKAIKDKSFLDELDYYRKTFIGRPTPLYFAKNLTNYLGGAKIYFKLEGLANTGAHKINNALGQGLLTKRMGKKRLIAETGAGQHGVATATIAAMLGLECKIFMGSHDVKRQRPNVFIMEMFGAEVVSVESGNQGLADAVDTAIGEWITCCDDTHYLLGSAVGPAPFPSMVKFFQSIISEEVKVQAKEANLDIEAMIACVGGGSNSLGFFSSFIDEKTPRLIGVEGGGISDKIGDHAKRLAPNAGSTVAAYHGYMSKFLLDKDGNVTPTHSISAGLDYPGVGPEVSYLEEMGRIEMVSARDSEVLEAVQLAAKNEGLLFALESAHALAHAIKIAKTVDKNKAIIVNMSGRGDKDIFITAKHFDRAKWKNFLELELEDMN